MKKALHHIVLTGFIVLFFISCKTNRAIEGASGMGALSEAEFLESVIENKSSFDAFSSKIKLNLLLGGKQTGVGGTLRMKRDEVIQLSIVPLLGIEVARIEITEENILVIDRMNRQYISVPVTELSLFAGTDMDFYTLQALFYNELFLPGKKEVGKGDLSAFSVKRAKENTLIRVKKTKKFQFAFAADSDNGQIVETEIKTASKYRLNWGYADFKPFESKSFPYRMHLAVEGTGTPLKADFVLSKPTVDDSWTSRTAISGKYKQIDINDLLKQLLDK